MLSDRFRDHARLGFADWVLRGIGQVVLQDNPLTGAFVLLGILWNSRVHAAACVIGAVVSTLVGLWLGADRARIRKGLYGFNGALVAIALVTYTSGPAAGGDPPDLALWGYIVLGAAFSSVLVPALGALLARHDVSALTMPFVLATWLLLGAVLPFSAMHAGAALPPAIPPDASGSATAYSLDTWTHGVFNGIAQVFFQHNRLTGVLIVVGIAVHSRIGAAMALLGATLAVALAVGFGAGGDAIRAGLFGYNAALTAIALGGLFVVLDLAGFLYALFGVAVTVGAWGSLATFLRPAGIPVLTAPFVLVTWLMLLARPGFARLVPIALADATTPEAHLPRRGAS